MYYTELSDIENSIILRMIIDETKKEFSARELWNELKDKLSLVTLIKTLEQMEKKGLLIITRPNRRGQKFSVRLTEEAFRLLPGVLAMYKFSFSLAIIKIQSIINHMLKKDKANILLVSIFEDVFSFIPISETIYNYLMEDAKERRLDFDFILSGKRLIFLKCENIIKSIFNEFFSMTSYISQFIDSDSKNKIFGMSIDDLRKKQNEYFEIVNQGFLNLVNEYNNNKKIELIKPSIFKDEVIEAMLDEKKLERLVIEFMRSGYKLEIFKYERSIEPQEMKELINILT
ncbi:MAG: hypothetical protein QXI12_13570 [Candidatus Methanomethyliaceae archaeon]